MLPQDNVVTKSGRILVCVKYFFIWCVSCRCVVFLFTGYYLTTEVRFAPNRWYVFFKYLLRSLGASEL